MEQACQLFEKVSGIVCKKEISLCKDLFNQWCLKCKSNTLTALGSAYNWRYNELSICEQYSDKSIVTKYMGIIIADFR